MYDESYPYTVKKTSWPSIYISGTFSYSRVFSFLENSFFQVCKSLGFNRAYSFPKTFLILFTVHAVNNIRKFRDIVRIFEEVKAHAVRRKENSQKIGNFYFFFLHRLRSVFPEFHKKNFRKNIYSWITYIHYTFKKILCHYQFYVSMERNYATRINAWIRRNQRCNVHQHRFIMR